ncbi:hypothetical protein MANES_18G136308v8 [Manihot esculenta]|uniref:Uncharacterized protein n=1 Tax=Manihot esculenta TaxID=3983 RepID=A0ACB7G0S7_MANES|nr:hypothetical protein MANES_18G136308v8 [Manihot esculenta]
MGRKKNKQKEVKSSPSPSSTSKALSEHSEDLNKTQKAQDKNPEDLKRWIEELSKSPEVIKALQNMASSSGDSGMASKSKAIIPAYGTDSLSQTVDNKDLSNPLKAVDLPKIQSSQGYNSGVYKWFLKNISEFEIEIEHGFNDINPWEFFRPKDIAKPQEYYQSILEETSSARIKHNFDKHHKGVITYSSIQIKRVVHPKDWPISSLYTAIQFKTLKKYSTLYNYFDYIDAWTNVFCIQNPTTTHSWLIYFDQQSIKTTTKFPNWFLKWWQYRGITDEVLSPEVLQYTTELNIPAIVKKHKGKWWGSFKNSTTEIVVKNWILKKAQFPAISYASKLALQGESSFGAQKAQCQAMLTTAKTPEEYKMICQQMFSQLGSGETVKSEKLKERKKPKRQSSSESESTASSTSSFSKNPASSHCDSNEDDCYGILPAIKIKSKTDKVKEKGKKKKEKVKRKGKGRKKRDTSSSSSSSSESE